MQQKEAAARIRVHIKQYLDSLMTHGAPQRKEWPKNGAIRCWQGEEVHYMDPDTKLNYRGAGSYMYDCALECALRDAPTTDKWWVHEYGEDKQAT